MKYYNTMTLSGLQRVPGIKLKSEQFPKFEFYFYIDENKIWWICELTSGFAVSSGFTLNEAKKIAIKNITKSGTEKFKRLIEEQIKEYGLANKSTRKERHGKRRIQYNRRRVPRNA